MILVESVKSYEVPEDFHKIIHKVSAYDAVELFTNDGAHIVSTNLLHELVSGRRYRRPSDGQEICIGWSQEVQDLLGMPLECWENMEAYLKDARWDNDDLRGKLTAIKSAGFLTRLKWLFTGVT